MNLISRSVTRFLSSSGAAKLPTRKWVLSRHVTGGVGTEAPEKESAPPKYMEYQQELANSVSLIGLVDEPVQTDSSPDGRFWAGTVISGRSESEHSSFWVPIIFAGDLAKSAGQHLKKDDRIHISGKLIQNEKITISNLQVIVETLNFVQDVSPADMAIEETITEKKPCMSSYLSVLGEEKCNALAAQEEKFKNALELGLKKFPAIKLGYSDPVELYGDRLKKEKSDGPSLEGQTATSEIETLSPEILKVDPSNIREEKSDGSSSRKKQEIVVKEISNPWNHLLANPKKWLDYRGIKANGLVKPGHPDFKRKADKFSLWLNSAPGWVLPNLKGLIFPTGKGKKSKEEMLKDLAENPRDWININKTKTSPRGPDFIHRETRATLWINDSWKLPPLQKKKED